MKAPAKEHVDNNTAVRKMLAERGVRPEALPPAEDVHKVRRRLEGEEKKLAQGDGAKAPLKGRRRPAGS